MRKCGQLRELAVASDIRAEAACHRSTEAKDTVADADQREDVLVYAETAKRTWTERHELGSGASERTRARGAERRSWTRQRLQARSEMDRSPEDMIGACRALPRRAHQRGARRKADAQADGRTRCGDCRVHPECRAAGAQRMVLLA